MTTAELSGLLREIIVISRQSDGRDLLASASTQTQIIGSFRAAAQPLPPGEDSVANSHSALPRWRFVLRQTDRIEPGDLLTWGRRVMTVRSVQSDHRFIPRTFLQAEENRDETAHL
ncbi:MAG: hypothetical protein ABJO01_02895 [Parasphingorhabdus sp.]|uniref:hypothetical protein n=1 Tax=Parasphingorhabdus sp. TaxID=2709688 RepID=UPI003296F414